MADKWHNWAMKTLMAEYNRSADTHLIEFPLPAFRHIHLYMKDESTHATGNLKHRLARSLFLYALVNNWIHDNTLIVEASSGNTALSEAYFAQLLDLEFTAVMPKTTLPEKIKAIQNYGGHCHLVDDASMIEEIAAQIAQQNHGYFIDQFTYAERAIDWRGNNNIAESIFVQMAQEPYPEPRWLVCGAGTGGTAATIGRYIRFRSYNSKLCVVDPEGSIFYKQYDYAHPNLYDVHASYIEGIGRPKSEPSFIASVIDEMIKVPDAASIAALYFIHEITGKYYGGSTGTSFCGAMQLIAEMHHQHESGSVVMIIGDGGERYQQTYYNPEWLAEHHYNVQTYLEQIKLFYAKGRHWTSFSACMHNS